MLLRNKPRHSLGLRAARRGLDLAIAGAAIAITAPLMLAIAVGIRLQDGGPAFFRQVRIGQDGEPFTIRKFRTLTVDDGRGTEPQLITPLGRLLRATSLDELPQFMNVLDGSMSVVGYRPLMPAEASGVYRTRPGMTGYFQLLGRATHHAPTISAFNHFQARDASLRTYGAVLFATAFSVVARVVPELRKHRTVAPHVTDYSPVPPVEGYVVPEGVMGLVRASVAAVQATPVASIAGLRMPHEDMVYDPTNPASGPRPRSRMISPVSTPSPAPEAGPPGKGLELGTL